MFMPLSFIFFSVATNLHYLINVSVTLPIFVFLMIHMKTQQAQLVLNEIGDANGHLVNPFRENVAIICTGILVVFISY